MWKENKRTERKERRENTLCEQVECDTERSKAECNGKEWCETNFYTENQQKQMRNWWARIGFDCCSSVIVLKWSERWVSLITEMDSNIEIYRNIRCSRFLCTIFSVYILFQDNHTNFRISNIPFCSIWLLEVFHNIFSSHLFWRNFQDDKSEKWTSAFFVHVCTFTRSVRCLT